jgi:hypothetical protein
MIRDTEAFPYTQTDTEQRASRPPGRGAAPLGVGGERARRPPHPSRTGLDARSSSERCICVVCGGSNTHPLNARRQNYSASEKQK